MFSNTYNIYIVCDNVYFLDTVVTDIANFINGNFTFAANIASSQFLSKLVHFNRPQIYFGIMRRFWFTVIIIIILVYCNRTIVCVSSFLLKCTRKLYLQSQQQLDQGNTKT